MDAVNLDFYPPELGRKNTISVLLSDLICDSLLWQPLETNTESYPGELCGSQWENEKLSE